ncbi:hypothetical protein [Dactylococcopsis salina]|uniref:Uncharacterized protein n=1 Tax=Dactylococcopsis salina (strain PCC 8305) TaxID=13035 RepID=K9YR00_DACS8|nr:hypothetical protein [Dactylococcopsis salina]AFZ49329.1 hypothetical protein Dacsa_0547 [Dactylococcopsis salina PCC 8305]
MTKSELSAQEKQAKMKNESITRVTWDKLDQMEDLTDWERVNNMTEEEIEQNALDDPDNPPLTDEELKYLKPLSNPPFRKT